MTTTATAPPVRTGRRPGLLPRTAVAAVAAAAAVAVVHLLAAAVGAGFTVAPGGGTSTVVGAPQAAAVAAGGALAGGVLAALLARWTARPARWFVLAVGLAVLVMAPNPVLAADEAATVVALELEHLVVAAVALAVLLPPLRERS